MDRGPSDFYRSLYADGAEIRIKDAHLGPWFQSKYFSMSFRLHINMHSCPHQSQI